jgi:hypothetical protein
MNRDEIKILIVSALRAAATMNYGHEMLLFIKRTVRLQCRHEFLF